MQFGGSPIKDKFASQLAVNSSLEKNPTDISVNKQGISFSEIIKDTNQEPNPNNLSKGLSAEGDLLLDKKSFSQEANN